MSNLNHGAAQLVIWLQTPVFDFLVPEKEQEKLTELQVKSYRVCFNTLLEKPSSWKTWLLWGLNEDRGVKH